MMKEKDIRTFLPFLIVVVSTFFLSGADLFEVFPSTVTEMKRNDNLMTLLIGADTFQAFMWLPSSLIFFKAWRKLKNLDLWYTDILWQLSGVFFCWFVLAVVRLWGVFELYLWIQGIVRFFVAIFGLYFLNTLYAARKLLYNPPTTEETKNKAEKFDKLIKMLSDD